MGSGLGSFDGAWWSVVGFERLEGIGNWDMSDEGGGYDTLGRIYGIQMECMS
jgi:hypothetical protein